MAGPVRSLMQATSETGPPRFNGRPSGPNLACSWPQAAHTTNRHSGIAQCVASLVPTGPRTVIRLSCGVRRSACEAEPAFIDACDAATGQTHRLRLRCSITNTIKTRQASLAAGRTAYRPKAQYRMSLGQSSCVTAHNNNGSTEQGLCRLHDERSWNSRWEPPCPT